MNTEDHQDWLQNQTDTTNTSEGKQKENTDFSYLFGAVRRQETSIIALNQRLIKLEEAATQANRRSALFLAYIIQQTGIQQPEQDSLTNINREDVQAIESMSVLGEDEPETYYELVDGETPPLEKLVADLVIAALNQIQNGDTQELLLVMSSPHVLNLLTPSVRAKVTNLVRDGVPEAV